MMLAALDTRESKEHMRLPGLPLAVKHFDSHFAVCLLFRLPNETLAAGDSPHSYGLQNMTR
jgi:hypothetical protein